MAFGSLAYLSVSSGPAQVFAWLQNINAVSGLLNWGVICLCWIRFNRARELQGIPRSSLPYLRRGLPYIGWYGFIASCKISLPLRLDSRSLTSKLSAGTIALVSGFSVFLKGNWSVSNFFAAYVSIVIYIALL